jgi:uncharacterized protein YneF (UPF0154 family)
MKTSTPDRGLLAVAALAMMAGASAGVWIVAQIAHAQWAALRPEINGAMLQFMLRGVIA